MQGMKILPFKSIAAALLLAIFFGPVGLFYVNMWMGVLLSLLGTVVLMAGYPWPIFFLWLCSCALSVWMAVSLSQLGAAEVDADVRKRLGKVLHWTYTFHINGYSLPQALKLIPRGH